MNKCVARQLNLGFLSIFLGIAMVASSWGISGEPQNRAAYSEALTKLQLNRNNPAVLGELLPIVHCSFEPSKYERILMSQLRNSHTATPEFRQAAEKIAELLVSKTVECFPTRPIEIQSPVATCMGEEFTNHVEFVSIMRSGDALLNYFIDHFPDARISKILIQRDERTAEPHFKYMKLTSSIASGNIVIITEPMIATGGTLEMAIPLLIEKGVKEENIIIASICAAPEGLLRLNHKFPKIKVVFNVLDERLNEVSYIVPGLGDFGDRFFGTDH